jgi:hypothetical protein
MKKLFIVGFHAQFIYFLGYLFAQVQFIQLVRPVAISLLGILINLTSLTPHQFTICYGCIFNLRMCDSAVLSRARKNSSIMQDSDSATSSEIGDSTEVDDSDFFEFLGDWSESIMFEGVADDVDYGEAQGSRFKDDSVITKKRRLEVINSNIRLTSNAVLLKISAEESPSSSCQLRKSSKNIITPGLVISQDILLKNPEELKLEIIPENLYQAFNGGNLKLVSHIITNSFTQDCAFQTMIMDQPLIGRQVRKDNFLPTSILNCPY